MLVLNDAVGGYFVLAPPSRSPLYMRLPLLFSFVTF